MVKNIFCLWLALFMTQHVSAQVKEKQATQKQPNIVFILADDLGYGDLSCYGSARIRTPHLDALAKSGIQFTQFYSGSTVSAPSRAS